MIPAARVREGGHKTSVPILYTMTKYIRSYLRTWNVVMANVPSSCFP